MVDNAVSDDIFAEMAKILGETSVEEKTEAQVVETTLSPETKGRKPRLNRNKGPTENIEKSLEDSLPKDGSGQIRNHPALEMAADALNKEAMSESMFDKEEVKPQTATSDAPGVIGVLFIDAIQIGAPVSAFSKVVEEATAALGGDYRIGDENGFGKGPGRFLNAVRTALRGKRFDGLYVNSRTPEGGIALEYLQSISQAVVKGV